MVARGLVILLVGWALAGLPPAAAGAGRAAGSPAAAGSAIAPADAGEPEAPTAGEPEAAAAADSAGSGAAEPEAPPSSCVQCHGQADLMGDEAAAVVRDHRRSVHGEMGLGCQDCHGGDPDPALAQDMSAAMDPAHEPDPFRGAPSPREVPGLCGGCHGDVAYMKRFEASPRVDQLEEYWTSRHGELLRGGDTRVATCVSCHGSHLVLRPDDNESRVYPTRVAETCAGCHADPELMAARGLPIDQYPQWRRSVHAAALLEREDLSAPTCNDCHGNHGARPPGIESIAFVCGQCHGREATLFRASPKEAAFRQHNEYLESVGDADCAACHEGPVPGAVSLRTFTECATCHGNHAIVRPSIGMLHPLPATPCALCHEVEPGLAGAEVAEPPGNAERYEQVKAGLLAEAGDRRGTELFDWLVERARRLPYHTETTEAGAGPTLRENVARLFRKFRIGTTTYTYPDPVTGEPVEAHIVRCVDCHAGDPDADEPTGGWQVGRSFLDGMADLTALTARAERLILAAERGGVSIGEGRSEIDGAVDGQIDLEVLVHTFAAGEGSQFEEKQAAALGHARAALEAGRAGLAELRHRHDGLKVSLVLILLVLVGLALWIRRLTREEAGDAAGE